MTGSDRPFTSKSPRSKWVTLDSALLARPDNEEIQLDLFGDYQSNVALYLKFQQYIRTHRPPLLAVWGKNDPFFLPAGAEAFKRDNPDAEIHLLNAGHFAVEREGPEIAAIIRDFLARKPPKQASSSSNSTNLTFETRAPPRGLLRSTGNGVKAVSLRGAHGSAPGVARG